MFFNQTFGICWALNFLINSTQISNGTTLFMVMKYYLLVLSSRTMVVLGLSLVAPLPSTLVPTLFSFPRHFHSLYRMSFLKFIGNELLIQKKSYQWYDLQLFINLVFVRFASKVAMRFTDFKYIRWIIMFSSAYFQHFTIAHFTFLQVVLTFD